MHSTFRVTGCDLISFVFSLVLFFRFQRCSSGTQAVARPSQSLVGQRTMRIVDWFRALSGWCSRRRCMMQWCVSVHPLLAKKRFEQRKQGPMAGLNWTGFSKGTSPIPHVHLVPGDKPGLCGVFFRLYLLWVPVALDLAHSIQARGERSKVAIINNYQYQQPLHVCFLD